MPSPPRVPRFEVFPARTAAQPPLLQCERPRPRRGCPWRLAPPRRTCHLPCHRPRDPEAFRATMLHFVNEVLPTLGESKPVPTERIEGDTLLFETNRLDSLSILHLIAKIEELTGDSRPRCHGHDEAFPEHRHHHHRLLP